MSSCECTHRNMDANKVWNPRWLIRSFGFLSLVHERCWNRVRPFFKVFEAQPCADRSQWAEYEDIKFFEFWQRLPLPLANFRSNFVCYNNVVTYEIYSFCYNSMWNIFIENRSEAKVTLSDFEKNGIVVLNLLLSICSGLCPKGRTLLLESPILNKFKIHIFP